MDDDIHKKFILAALRGATARARAMQLDLDTIGVALSGGLITTETAVAWIRESDLMWIVGAIPEPVTTHMEIADDQNAA